MSRSEVTEAFRKLHQEGKLGPHDAVLFCHLTEYTPLENCAWYSNTTITVLRKRLKEIGFKEVTV